MRRNVLGKSFGFRHRAFVMQTLTPKATCFGAILPGFNEKRSNRIAGWNYLSVSNQSCEWTSLAVVAGLIVFSQQADCEFFGSGHGLSFICGEINPGSE